MWNCQMQRNESGFVFRESRCRSGVRRASEIEHFQMWKGILALASGSVLHFGRMKIRFCC